MCCLQETHFRPKDTYRLKVKVWMEKYILDIQMEKYIPCTWKAKESWSSNLHTRQNDFKIKNITRDKEGHYIIIKGSIQEQDITIVNIYVPKIGASNT